MQCEDWTPQDEESLEQQTLSKVIHPDSDWKLVSVKYSRICWNCYEGIEEAEKYWWNEDSWIAYHRRCVDRLLHKVGC